MSRIFPKSWDGKWPDLDRWIAEGEMKKQPIMERVYRYVQVFFRDDERESLQKAFDSASTKHEEGNASLMEPSFISLLTNKGSLPQSPEGVRAGKIIYAIVAYVSTLPFPAHQYDPNLRLDGLDWNQLARGLLCVIPGRVSFRSWDEEEAYWMQPNWEEHRVCPPRSKTRHLRLIFQSLSSPYEDKVQHDTESRSTPSAEARAPDSSSPHQDDSEDPILEHLLDVLYDTQHIHDPVMSPVDREKFKSSPIAEQLLAENQTASFSSLAIPAERFEDLVKVLLYLQYSTPELLPALSEFSGAASSICAAFLQNSGEGLITWQMFEYGMRVTAPYLFDPLYTLLSRNLLGKESFFDVDGGSEVFVGPPNVLTIPRASQLYTFLIGGVSFGDLECFHHFTGPNMPTPSTLISALESSPETAIMILSGTASNGITITFGLYSFKPKLDGSSIQRDKDPLSEREGCTIFQLEPVHDVFRGVEGSAGWKFDEDSSTFGEGDGVVMVLKDRTSRGEVKHQVSDSDGDEMTGTYEGNRWRGDWTVEFEIEGIAIWGEPTWEG
jgi:hypothetical protein